MIRTNVYYNTSRKCKSNNKKEIGGRCVECGCYTSPETEGVRVSLPSQQRGVWLCRCHQDNNWLNSYSYENSRKVGTPTADGISISCELESMGTDNVSRAYLISNGFVATSDCTVDIEYKSPIYASLSSMAKVAGGIEYLHNNSDIDFDVINDEVGLHTHFGFIDNRYPIHNLLPYFEELTRPLADVVENVLTGSEREAIFGSDFRYYADRMSYPRYRENYRDLLYTHENWINIQHDYSIEIRLFRFTSAENYMYYVKVFRDIFKIWAQLYTWKPKYNTNQLHIKARKLGEKAANLFVECARNHGDITI